MEDATIMNDNFPDGVANGKGHDAFEGSILTFCRGTYEKHSRTASTLNLWHVLFEKWYSEK
jgi:hypothetical protein